MFDEVPDRPHKGRGAVSNRTGRFEATSRVAVDDGWSYGDDDEPAPLRTTLGVDAARSILSRNQSPDLPFDTSINPYRGCEHGCVYCYARPTHAYLGLSPGLDFETKLFHKPNAADLLDRELRAPGYRPQVIALGTNTDPYQPVERELGLTRRILEVLAAFNNPVMITTKSALALRDLDILAAMAAKGLAQVGVSLTTLDRDLARKMEPRAATPARRLETIRRLSDAGVPVAVLASPMIPSLNDHELEGLIEAGADQGAVAASAILLRLPLEITDLFTEWAREHVPDRMGRILSLVRQSRGGKLYNADFDTRMKGTGPYADLMRRRLARVCARLGLREDRAVAANITLFQPPSRPGDQLSLF